MCSAKCLTTGMIGLCCFFVFTPVLAQTISTVGVENTDKVVISDILDVLPKGLKSPTQRDTRLGKSVRVGLEEARVRADKTLFARARSAELSARLAKRNTKTAEKKDIAPMSEQAELKQDEDAGGPEFVRVQSEVLAPPINRLQEIYKRSGNLGVSR